MKIIYQNLEEIEQVAEKIIKFAENTKIWLFNGEMGAGKTTLIKAICQQLNVLDVVQSPTYSIVNEYLTKDNKKIYHFDFYRIKDETEAMDMGYEEYFFSDALCLIEWATKIPDLIPQNHLVIDIFLTDNMRKIELNKI